MRSFTLAIALLCLFAVPLRAEWKEPADGVVTDQQLTRYLGAMKDINALYTAAGKASEGQGAIGAMGLWARTNEKYQAILTKHQLTDEEFGWVGGKVTEGWVHAMLQLNWEKKGQPSSLETEKKLKADIDVQKAKLAAYEKAAKDGTKVLEQREVAAIISRSAEEIQAAETSVRDLEKEITAQKAEIASKEAAAKASDALAAKPPAEVTADERADYIEGKKAEATAARQEAKDLQDQLADKDKTLKEYQATIVTAQARQKNPGMPVTDQEKADVATENETGIKSTKETIKMTEDALAMVVESREAGQKQMAEMSKDVPKQNIDLLKARYGDFCEAMGMKNDFAEEKK